MEAWQAINRTPDTKTRKRSIILYGAPGAGKTLISKILTTGHSVGVVSQSGDKFAFENCYNKDSLRWEEVKLNQSQVDYYKQVFEGQGYLIVKKSTQGNYQYKYTPVVGTSNSKVTTQIQDLTDRQAIKDRVWEIYIPSGYITPNITQGLDLYRVKEYCHRYYKHLEDERAEEGTRGMRNLSMICPCTVYGL